MWNKEDFNENTTIIELLNNEYIAKMIFEPFLIEKYRFLNGRHQLETTFAGIELCTIEYFKNNLYTDNNTIKLTLPKYTTCKIHDPFGYIEFMIYPKGSDTGIFCENINFNETKDWCNIKLLYNLILYNQFIEIIKAYNNKNIPKKNIYKKKLDDHNQISLNTEIKA